MLFFPSYSCCHLVISDGYYRIIPYMVSKCIISFLSIKSVFFSILLTLEVNMVVSLDPSCNNVCCSTHDVGLLLT